MAGLSKTELARREELTVDRAAEAAVKVITDRLKERPRITLSTLDMDSRVRARVRAALLGKGCAVEWTGRQLVVEE